jgi:hypothetical protein
MMQVVCEKEFRKIPRINHALKHGSEKIAK